MGEMARAAATYAMVGSAGVIDRGDGAPTTWPWSAQWWKPSDRRRDLVKAGALILAEIERLDRATGPDLTPAPVTVAKTYTETEAQAMVAAALRQAAKLVGDMLRSDAHACRGTSPETARDRDEYAEDIPVAIEALIPQPAAPAPVVVDWQARAEAAEARGMERAVEIAQEIAEAARKAAMDERPGSKARNDMMERCWGAEDAARAILAAAKEPRHE
jgi:hypothetical protein